MKKISKRSKVKMIVEKVTKKKAKNVNKSDEWEKYFPVVEASKLSVKEEFLNHEPKTEAQEIFKKNLIGAIESGLTNFRVQKMDPYCNNGEIGFKEGERPLVKKSIIWWHRKAKKFLPEKNSRLGTENERYAFLGIIIKFLIEEKGYTVSEAWEKVCDCSSELGHYSDSEEAKKDFEPTGSRKIYNWCDLGNTYKIIRGNKKFTFLIVGGGYNRKGDEYPLADGIKLKNLISKFAYSTGWIVCSV